MNAFHLLRPWWLLALLPLIFLIYSLWRKRPQIEAWAAICDKHLLDHLLQSKEPSKRGSALFFLFMSALSMIIALCGPSWSRLPVPTYKQIQPRVLVLDMSDAMLARDLSPDRLTRAKFKLHDLFQHRDGGQFALVVYTGEPFVVSPLTDDAQTIDSFLSALTPDIMPVDGAKLDDALEQAGQLISQGHFSKGQILVLTSETPNESALAMAKSLANKHIFTSIMPIRAEDNANVLFQKLADAGQGQLLNMTNTEELDKWLSFTSNNNQYRLSQHDDIPLWRDEGRWFILPALIFLFPVFRRRWLQRLS